VYSCFNDIVQALVAVYVPVSSTLCEPQNFETCMDRLLSSSIPAMASTARKCPMSLVQDVITPMIPHIAETIVSPRGSEIGPDDGDLKGLAGMSRVCDRE
jgi:hypothetical protein